jgi:hypothetical protein
MIAPGMNAHGIAGVVSAVDVAGDTDIIGVRVIIRVLVERVRPSRCRIDDGIATYALPDLAQVVLGGMRVVTSHAVECEGGFLWAEV